MTSRTPSLGFLLLVTFFGLLLLLAGYGVLLAFKIGGGTHMSVHGYIALGLAVVLTALLGGGLMALAFYSARHGYDDGQGTEDDNV